VTLELLSDNVGVKKRRFRLNVTEDCIRANDERIIVSVKKHTHAHTQASKRASRDKIEKQKEQQVNERRKEKVK